MNTFRSSGVVGGIRERRLLIDGPADSGLRKKRYPRSNMAMADSIKIMDIKFASFGGWVSDISLPPLDSIRKPKLT